MNIKPTIQKSRPNSRNGYKTAAEVVKLKGRAVRVTPEEAAEESTFFGVTRDWIRDNPAPAIASAFVAGVVARSLFVRRQG